MTLSVPAIPCFFRYSTQTSLRATELLGFIIRNRFGVGEGYCGATQVPYSNPPMSQTHVPVDGFIPLPWPIINKHHPKKKKRKSEHVGRVTTCNNQCLPSRKYDWVNQSHDVVLRFDNLASLSHVEPTRFYYYMGLLPCIIPSIYSLRDSSKHKQQTAAQN